MDIPAAGPAPPRTDAVLDAPAPYFLSSPLTSFVLWAPLVTWMR